MSKKSMANAGDVVMPAAGMNYASSKYKVVEVKEAFVVAESADGDRLDGMRTTIKHGNYQIVEAAAK